MKEVLALIIRNEGGYDNLYYADGLQTRAGIAWKWNEKFYNSKGIFHHDDINRLTKDDIDEFYEEYARKSRADIFGGNFDLIYSHVDHCINDGWPDGNKLLQAAINLCLKSDEKLLSVDGAIGPKTIGALKKVLSEMESWKFLEIHKGCRRNRYWKKFNEKLRTSSREHAFNCLVSWNRRVL